ncbi:uncharacterized protein LOC106868051 [Octopus bimaculoides]|uniref:Claudin n=1 Tax=Octopus bimaculoides TaxID=37653 RepID=A0A0L8HYD2_OCTBM|nr:uncharacterized protein LOC106868051 [Octopus bimaculoides]|eukprot:XP_014768646.1 PREDICTED: uncharacterized protein LOC106868051 [Octopus bimaculoides]
MASEKCSFGIGLGLLILSFILYMIGFSTSYWLETFEEVQIGLERLGLWQICFTQDGMSLNSGDQARGITYKNCYWVFHENIRLASDTFGISFFLGTQVLSAFSVALLILVLIMAVIRMCGCCQTGYKVHVAVISAVLTLIAITFQISALLLFGLKTGHKDWLTNHRHIHLSWSYGLCAGGALILIFAALFFALAAFTAYDTKKAKAKAKKFALSVHRY